MQARPLVIVADDHPLVRAALARTVSAVLPEGDVLEADSFERTVARLEASAGGADLLLLDLQMPGMHGLDGLVLLRERFPAVPVMVVSANEDHRVIRRSVALGIAGYVPKSSAPEAIVEALRAVLDGGLWLPPDEVGRNGADPGGEGRGGPPSYADLLAQLTPQQAKVFDLLSAGRLNKQIAFELQVTEATVKAHVSAILRKLGVHSRTQAVLLAARLIAERPQ